MDADSSRRTVNLIVAIDNAYAAHESIFNQFDRIRSDVRITVIFIDDIGRGGAYAYLLDLAEKKIISELVVIKRVKDIFGFIGALISLRDLKKKEFDYVLIGSSCNIEDSIIKFYLNKTAIIIGVLMTVPSVVSNQVKSQSTIKFTVLNLFERVLKKFKEWGGIKFFVELLNRILLFYAWKAIGIPDEKAKKNSYTNKLAVQLHLVANPYWAFLIENEYLGEKVIAYKEKVLGIQYSSENDSRKKRLMLIVGTNNLAYKRICSIVGLVNEIVELDIVSIRAHPRCLDVSDLLSKIKKKYKDIKIELLENDENPVDQAVQHGLVIGYYSALINRLQEVEGLSIFVDEIWNQIELATQMPITKITGSAYGFNRNIAFIKDNGDICCDAGIKNDKSSYLYFYEILNKIIGGQIDELLDTN